MPALTMFEVTPDHPVPISPQGGTATVTVLTGDTLYYADTPQVSAAHNQGSVTAGNVQSFTNPAWVRSASLSTVLAQVTAATVPTASLPGSVALATSPQGDPLNRTQVLGTSTVAAPSLRQFVFADDLPFGAAGDVKRIADGAITTGTNQLSSPSYTFTAADVGKVVEVLGAITTSTAPNLYGYIGSVAGGVASIVSTQGGSTPVNASVTVTGATVTFGTDDSAAVQNVANAVSTAGGGTVAFTPFKGYWFAKHVPASNVTYDGNGAVFYAMPLPSDGVNPNPAIWLSPGFTGQGTAGVANVTFRRMIWAGHGKEVKNQHPIRVQAGVNFRFYDCDLSSYSNDGIYVIDVTGARVVNCTLTNVCSAVPPGTSTTGNPINLSVGAYSNTYPLTELHCEGNTVKGQLSAGIDITPGSVNTAPQTATFKAVITSNVIDSPASVFASIVVELGGSGGVPTYPAQDVVIANNTCTGGSVSAYFSSNQTPNPTLISRMIIAGNTINTATGVITAQPGIDFRASHGLVVGNVVQAYAGIALSTGASTVAVTGDVTNLSTQVLNVAGGGAIINGTPLTGTGIPSGTFLQAGAGTTTWTLSQAFTGTTQTGLAITAHPQGQNMKVADNDIHIVAGGTSTIYGIQTSYIRSSSIADNTIVFDSGVANGRGISLNNSGWIRVRDNDIENTSSDGIYATGCNDLRIKSNDIYNPSASGPGANGIHLNGVTGTANLIIDNDIVDDRATHLMANALQTQSTATNLIIRGGVWLGATSGLIDTLTGILRIENVYPYDPVGLVTVTVPTTGVAVASVPYWRTFYVTASTSTVQMAIQNGPSPVIPASAFGTIRVPPGKTVTPTYTVAPTWVVEGE